MLPTRNPHNQYLLTASQVGLVGLALLLLLVLTAVALRESAAGRTGPDLARGLVLTIVVGSLFNSLLIDHTESMFFAWMSGLLYAGYARRTAPRPS